MIGKLMDHNQEFTKIQNIMNIKKPFMRISTHHETMIFANII